MLADRYASELAAASLRQRYDIAWSLARARPALRSRLLLPNAGGVRATHLLRDFARNGSAEGVFVGEALSGGVGVAFVYGGEAANWLSLGRRLFRESSCFRGWVAEFEACVLQFGCGSLVRALRADCADAFRGDVALNQAMCFAVQAGVTTQLKKLHVCPDAVLGYGAGEIAAAWACGALGLEQVASLLAARAEAIALCRGLGGVAGVRLPVEDVCAAIRELGLGDELEIAGFNSPLEVTVSGSSSALSRFGRRVRREAVGFRVLEPHHPLHSAFIDRAEGRWASRYGRLEPNAVGTGDFVSSVTGGLLDCAALNENYWWHNLREPVDFAGGVRTLSDLGCEVFLGIGRVASLCEPVSDCLGAWGRRGQAIEALAPRRGVGGARAVTEAAMRIQLLAEAPQWRGFFTVRGKRVSLPLYAVESRHSSGQVCGD